MSAVVSTTATKEYTIGIDDTLHGIEHVQRATVVRVFDAMYLNGLEGSSLGSRYAATMEF